MLDALNTLESEVRDMPRRVEALADTFHNHDKGAGLDNKAFGQVATLLVDLGHAADRLNKALDGAWPDLTAKKPTPIIQIGQALDTLEVAAGLAAAAYLASKAIEETYDRSAFGALIEAIEDRVKAAVQALRPAP